MPLSNQLQTALTESAVAPSGDVPHKTEGLDGLFEASLEEAKGNTGALSKVKKKPAPHMWFIAKAGSGWVVSIGDPRKGSSKTQRTFHDKEDLKYWVKHEKKVSNDHVIDQTGLKLVSPYYTQWYVDNMSHTSKR